MAGARILPVRLIKTRRFGDDRGWFSETYRRDRFVGLGVPDLFVQDNHSYSPCIPQVACRLR
ncbi:MAG: dTDP-4-dehydrorhamnose 3,5-epimerase family protein [Alphaproteobacteria bacterium]